MSWVKLFKISICREIYAYWLLDSQLYVFIFWFSIWLCYQFLIHACSETNIRENFGCLLFFFFLSLSNFLGGTSRQLWLSVWTRAATDCRPDAHARVNINLSFSPSNRTPLSFLEILFFSLIFSQDFWLFSAFSTLSHIFFPLPGLSVHYSW